MVVVALPLARKHRFAGLAAVARPRSVSIWAWRSQGGKSSHRVYHVLLSKRFSAKKVLRLVREHWSIESVP